MFAIIMDALKTPSLNTDRSSRQRFCKVFIISQVDLIHIYRTLNLQTAQHTFVFSSACGTFTKLRICWVVKQISRNLKNIAHLA